MNSEYHRQSTINDNRDIPMNTRQQLTTISSMTLAVVIGTSGCSEMSRRDQNTLAGAGIGGVAGAVLTDGSALGTFGGAAVGGIIGHELGASDDNHRDRHDDRHHDRDWNRDRDVYRDRHNDWNSHRDNDWYGY